MQQDEPESLNIKDPFNMSNDEYYNPKLATDNALRTNLGGSILQVGRGGKCATSVNSNLQYKYSLRKFMILKVFGVSVFLSLKEKL